MTASDVEYWESAMTVRTRAGRPGGRDAVASDGAVLRPAELTDWTSWKYLRWLPGPIEPFSVRVQTQRQVHLKMRAARKKTKEEGKKQEEGHHVRRRRCRNEIRGAARQDLSDRTKGRVERLGELYADGLLCRTEAHPPPVGPACRPVTASELDRIAAVVRKSSILDEESTLATASRHWCYRRMLKIAAIVLTAAVLGMVWHLPVWAAGAFACVQAGSLLAWWWWSVDEWWLARNLARQGDLWLIAAGVAVVVAFAFAGRPPPWLAVLLAVPLLGLTLLAEIMLIVAAGLFVIPWIPYGWFHPIDPYACLVCRLVDAAHMTRHLSVAEDPELWHYAHVVQHWMRHMIDVGPGSWEETFKGQGAPDPAAAARRLETWHWILDRTPVELADLEIRPAAAKLAHARDQVKGMLQDLQPREIQGGTLMLVRRRRGAIRLVLPRASVDRRPGQ